VTAVLQLTLPLDQAPDLVARLRRLGLPDDLPVSVHRNRSVMVTLDRDRGLRVHQGYAWAPDEVLEAIVRWSWPGLARRLRREAQSVMLGFPVHDHVPRQPSRASTERPVDGDDARLSRLQLLHLELNERWFGGALAPISIRLSGRMRRKLGHYEHGDDSAAAIVISRRHIRRDGWRLTERTLLHEMVHQWQAESGLPIDHGRAFRRKAREVGIEPRAVAGIDRR
jgi:hypothetical protein